MNSKIIIVFIIVSILLFVIGIVPPVGAKIYDPNMAYALFAITLPALTISSAIGIIIGVRYKNLNIANYNISRFGWGLFLLNIFTLILIWSTPYHVVS